MSDVAGMASDLQPMRDPYRLAALRRKERELWQLYREALQELADYEGGDDAW